MSEEKDIPEESHEQDDVNENNSETAAEPQTTNHELQTENMEVHAHTPQEKNGPITSGSF